jgi:Na+-driven multidrug efflux pump
LIRPGSRVDIRREHFRIELPILQRLIQLSASATFQVFVGMASWIGLMLIITKFGSNAIAGYTFGIRIIIFALLPSFGMSNAAATMVGQALGARMPDRAERAVWLAGFYNACFLGVIGLLFAVFAPQLISIFTPDPAITPYGIACLRIVSCGFLFYAYGMVLTQSFNGAGDTRTPTIINLLVFWLWEIPMAWLLAIHFGLGPRGVFLAITIAFSTLAIISAVVFKRGRWKKSVV